MLNRHPLLFIVILLCLGALSVATAQTTPCKGPNLWYNGDFEVTDDLLASGWNPNCWPAFYEVITSQTQGFQYPDIKDHTPGTGDHFMWSNHSLTPCVFFPIGSDVNILVQDIHTIPGQTYRFGVWTYAWCLNLGGQFGLAVDGTILLSQDLNNIPNCTPGWKYYSVDWVATDTVTYFGVIDVNWHIFGWDMAFDDIEVNQVSDFAIKVSNDTTVCAGQCVPLTVKATKGSIESLSWAPAASVNDPTDSITVACLDTSTDLWVFAEDAAGCRDTQMVSIEIKSLASVDLGPDLQLCAGACANLSANTPLPNATFAWSTGENSPNVTVCPPSNQEVRVTITDAGCVATDTIQLTPSPIPFIQTQAPQCAPDLQSWSVPIYSPGASNVFTNEGTIQNLGSDVYIINNVPISSILNINVLDANNCPGALTVAPPDCQCPTIQPPVSGGDAYTCAGQPFPSLSASAGGSMEITWYSALTGGTLLASNTPSFLPPGLGTYYAEAIDPVNGCASFTRTAVNLLERAPLTIDAGSNVIQCVGECTTLSFSGIAAPTVVEWSNSALTPSIYVCPTATTTYSVTVTDSFGCTGVDSVEVLVDPLPGFSFNLAPICNDSLTAWSISFTVQNASSIETTTGSIVQNGANDYTIINIPKGQSVKISAHSLMGGCKTSSNIPAPVCDCPTDIPAPVSQGDRKICEGQPIPYFNALVDFGLTVDWYDAPSGGVPILQGNLSFLPPAAGTYYMESRKMLNNCPSLTRTPVTLTVTPPPVVNLPELAIIACGEDYAILDATNAATGNDLEVIWQTPSGETPLFPNGNNLESEVYDAGTYVLTIRDLFTTCAATDTTIVEKVPAPVLEVAIKQPRCPGENGDIAVVGVTGGLEPFLFTLDGLNYVPDTLFTDIPPGPYALSIRDAADCEVEWPFVMTEPVEIGLNLEATGTVPLGASYQLYPTVFLPPSAIDTAYWTPNTGVTCADCLQTEVTPLQSEIYTLTVLDTNGCMEQAQIRLIVNDQVDLYFPNIIRPESTLDGNNLFLPFARNGLVQEVSALRIWNRWGELMFEQRQFQPNDPSFAWDGTFRKKPVPPGVYSYWAKIILIDGRSVEQDGDVLIVK